MPCDYHQLPHTGIRSLEPYIPGKSIEEVTRELGLNEIIKLASNENPLGCSPLAKEALQTMSGMQIARYPSPPNHPLMEKLSAKLAVPSTMLTLGDGSDLLFFFLLTCFALNTGKHIITHEYAFMSYQIQAQTLGIPVIVTAVEPEGSVNIEAIISASNEHTAMIFIANPNNPTGLLISLSQIKRLLDAIPASTLLILDEAYYEYAYSLGDRSTLDLMTDYPNLIITRTFSKAYGLAALRLGYAIAHPQISELIQRVQLPFVVNFAAMTAANAALDDLAFIQQTIQLNAQGMQQLQEGLEALNLDYFPSCCNFISINCRKNADPIFQYLLKQGIIVRPLMQYKLPNYLRVTVGDARQNALLLDKLSLYFSKNNLKEIL